MAESTGIAGWDRASDGLGPTVQNEGEEHAPPALRRDVETIDGLMDALYASISGPAGAPRDWARARTLYAEQAMLAPATTLDGGAESSIFDIEGYRRDRAPYFERHGFHEMEVARRTERFGSIAQVFSTYESRRHPAEPPFMRGINSVQLIWRRGRWWILSIAWQHESPGEPIPPHYLPARGADPGPA